MFIFQGLIEVWLMRTTGHKSPEQLYTARCLLLQNLNIDALDFDDVVDDNYGVDLDDTLHRTDAQDAVVIPENRIKFTDTDIRALKSVIHTSTCSIQQFWH